MTRGELIARLEAASEGSRALDRAVALAAGVLFIDEDNRLYALDRDDGGRVYGGLGEDILIRPFTTSLDAIVALIERKLPGWSWGVSGALSPPCTGLLYEPAPTASGYRVKVRISASKPPLALCIALLRALAQHQGEAEHE